MVNALKSLMNLLKHFFKKLFAINFYKNDKICPNNFQKKINSILKNSIIDL